MTHLKPPGFTAIEYHAKTLMTKAEADTTNAAIVQPFSACLRCGSSVELGEGAIGSRATAVSSPTRDWHGVWHYLGFDRFCNNVRF
ncbi:MAG: hypothetical protein Ct9H300mP14_14230 [Gammaproteobacteria bacterium]|nr:MAG: hypothetical protein Ct9H300mP14_14230 [Gammaproteobacteria bacterium]